MFVRHLEVPNVVIVPIADKGAIGDVFVAWQRGKAAAPVRALIDALDPKVSTHRGRRADEGNDRGKR
jgi:hypothetical protein